MKKSILLIALLATLLVFCAPLSVIAEEKIVPIYTEAELAAIRNDLSGHYRLMNDLTLTNAWKPIGYDQNSAFVGTFDGSGHTIRGLRVEGSEMYAGLFGYSKGVVKDITVVDGSVDVAVGSYDQMHSGLVVGYNDGGTVERCRVADSVVRSTSHSFNDNHAGGVVGYSKGGTISACENRKTSVTAQNVLTTSYNEFFVGGIVGAVVGTRITNCQNSGDILGGKVGGIVGCLSGGEVNTCYNVGAVSTQMVEKGYGGGVVGYAENAMVRNVYSIGDIKVNTAVVAAGGGVIGDLQGGKLENTYALGELSVTVRSQSGQRYAGGCVGNSSGTLHGCYHPNYLPTGGNVQSLTALREVKTFREFDFSNVWTMEGRASYPYPELRTVPMTADFKVPVQTTTESVSTTKPTTSFTYPIASGSSVATETTTVSTMAPTTAVSAPTESEWILPVFVTAVVLAVGMIVCLIIVIVKRKK